MTVKQSKNGTWFTQFRCKDKFGNEVHKCKRGFSTPEEAQAWEDDFIASAGCTMAMTFGEFFQVYEADVRPRLRDHTWRQKEYTIKSKILPFFEKKRMAEISSLDIVRWQNELMSPSANGGKGYSPTYLRTVNNQLTAILNHAARFYGLSPNPAVAHHEDGFEGHQGDELLDEGGIPQVRRRDDGKPAPLRHLRDPLLDRHSRG